ncbi:MAG: hypothetical protein ACYTDU_13485 [Planctomycetota bacterium]
MQGPPTRSEGIFHDLGLFLARRPAIETLMEVEDPATREDYVERIRQRLGISVEEYAVLNIHRIGIEAPLRLIFEELLTWHNASVWWPNHLASVHRTDGSLERIRMLLFGTHGSPIELFRLHAVRIRRDPGPADLDSARYVLYETSGGYPIGVFGMFVRSRIADRGEKERSQVFFAVGFNFYGKKDWPHRRVINPIWEWVHNRATANILNRFKRVCEATFRRLEA